MSTPHSRPGTDVLTRTAPRGRAALAAAALVVLATGCSGSDAGGSALADTDPAGAQACAALVRSLADPDDRDAATRGVFDAGAAADRSTTPAIKASVIDILTEKGVDTGKLAAACRAAGVDVPQPQD